MSTAPSSGATSLRSSISRASRRASGTPRVWMPTSASRSRSGFASMISWAILDRVLPSAPQVTMGETSGVGAAAPA
jgi:hypothetical protein